MKATAAQQGVLYFHARPVTHLCRVPPGVQSRHVLRVILGNVVHQAAQKRRVLSVTQGKIAPVTVQLFHVLLATLENNALPYAQ